MEIIENSCIFLNMELNINNINSKLEHLGKIPRLYETETLRLIKSIRGRNELNKIPIYLILFRELHKYNPIVYEELKKLNVTFLFPKLTDKTKETIKTFKNGFMYIPLTGYLVENTKQKIKQPDIEADHLVDIYNRVPELPEYGLKLDSDMVLIQNIFDNPLFLESIETDKPIVGQYDKDFGTDCKERKNNYKEIYENRKMSNTCLVFSKLSLPIYTQWWYFLLDTKFANFDDYFEEVAYDVTHEIDNESIGLKNFQIGENYLCYKDLTDDELKDIYFYHGKLLMEENFMDKIDFALEILLRIKLIKKAFRRKYEVVM